MFEIAICNLKGTQMMSAFAQKPWLLWPLTAALVLAALYGGAAYFYGRSEKYPRTVRSSGFTGIVRETAKFTLLGSGAGLIASILAAELKPYVYFRQAMLAVLLISLIASILNYYMSAALDTRMGDDGKSVKLSSPLWAVIHGVVFGLSLAAAIILLAAIINFAASY